MLDHPHIPEAHRAAAETVRAHLVHHRGGAPFLSPADTLLLVRWLDDGVSVTAMLAAIERCAASRRKSRPRTRFTLTAAKRHLHKAPLEAPALDGPVGDGHPFAPLLDELQHLGDSGLALSGALEALPEPAVDQAVALCASHLEVAWRELPAAEREQHLRAAVEELGDLASLVDADTLRELAEEVARHRFRASWPRLDTATFAALVPA
ncbi:MAG: hypothetical protein H6736_08245 [Alphaproteobacteria bacterium]|nr:hypothetical protein [Alphaproteobacteria bacterium]